MAAMSLSALLSELRRNLLHDRSDQVGGTASDYLWDDSTLVRYIDQACRRFARRSLCIRDNVSPSATQITTVDGQAFYPLHPAVFAVLSVRMAGDNTDLARAGHDGFDNYHTPDLIFFDPSQLEQMPPGKPLAWSTDESVLVDTNGSVTAMNLRLFPMVAAPYDGVLGTLRVIREPLVDLVLSNLTAFPEIPPAHHLDMLDWAAYLALRNVDTDVAGAGAAQRAADFAARFEGHCQDARKEVMRKLFSPLQWGFGHSGWSWETF